MLSLTFEDVKAIFEMAATTLYERGSLDVEQWNVLKKLYNSQNEENQDQLTWVSSVIANHIIE